MELQRREEQDAHLRISFVKKKKQPQQLDVIVLLREPLQVNCVSQSHFEGINCIRIDKQQYFLNKTKPFSLLVFFLTVENTA